LNPVEAGAPARPARAARPPVLTAADAAGAGETPASTGLFCEAAHGTIVSIQLPSVAAGVPPARRAQRASLS